MANSTLKKLVYAKNRRVTEAIEIAVAYGSTDGAHHKAWVIDQMVRRLAGKHYNAVVKYAKDGKDGPDTYEWDVGIAP